MSEPDEPESGAVVVKDWAQLTELYDESMALVEETAAYLSDTGETEKESLPPMAKTAFISESMRLTTRLTQMMSWLMLQRALAGGEISEEEARQSENRLRQQPPAPAATDRTLLPDRLAELVTRSESLYNRIERLEKDFRDGASDNAVQSMIERIETEIKDE